ncbi:sugar phosphate isomerase/epimerase family protein [Halomonas sp. V046]|uniref:sugar phosphate isomerase/epimerase family protein n=1 Tax=Halomonas sp. V046 TaxID=3459611 RepID=UPI004043C389
MFDAKGSIVTGGLSALMVACAVVATPVAAAEPSHNVLPVAVQMYTLRDFGTIEEQFAAVERAGIPAVELVNDQGLSADALEELLERFNLDVASSHVPLDLLRHHFDDVVAFQTAIGNDTVVIPYLDEELRPDDAEGWRAFGEEVGAIGRRLAAADIRLAYHNHDFEMQTFDGRTALEILFEAAGPELMAEIDLAWVQRGGQDPAEYLAHFDDRLFAVHAKDNAPEGTAEDQRGFAILGQGVLDWDAILPAAQADGVQWYILEHDLPHDAEAVMVEGKRFLSQRLPTQLAN